MIQLHFISKNESIPENFNVDYAEEFANFLIEDEKKRIEFEKNNPSEIYISNRFPITDCIYIQKKSKNNNISTIKLDCVEYLVGNQKFKEWKCSTPEVRKAITETRVAGSDWYSQFATNPDSADDRLSDAKDLHEYLTESKKIENGTKVGKYENR